MPGPKLTFLRERERWGERQRDVIYIDKKISINRKKKIIMHFREIRSSASDINVLMRLFYLCLYQNCFAGKLNRENV